MQIEWVNHASFVVRHEQVALISDPWLFGTAFDDGWSLLSPTRFRPEDFATLTHVWVSHEHPDHFHPPSLRSIPAEIRARLTFLYQETEDRKVVEFARELGFGNVIELPSGEWFELAPGFRVMCQPFPDDDSWLAVQAGDRVLLNLNDCMVQGPRQVGRVREQVAYPIDVLLAQFSYANWVGNPGETERHRAVAERILQRMALQVDILQPRFVIPFASFVRFCHEENAYLNEGMNTIRGAAEFLNRESDATVVVLYPGDTWEIGAPHDNRKAIESYESDAVAPFTPLRSDVVPLRELKDLAASYVQQLRDHHSRASLRILRTGGLLRPAHIYLTDHERAVALTLEGGLRASARTADNCDVALSSSALAYCFRHMWGGNTLLVNGRYTTPPGGNFEHFRRYLLLADLVNHGKGVMGYIAPRAGRVWNGVLERGAALARR